MRRIFIALMLLVSVSVLAGEHTVSLRTNLSDANQNGSIDIPMQHVAAGTIVKVYSHPSEGYGMSRGVFYATKNANGEYLSEMSATPKATYPDDRASLLDFEFVMPDADVEVWAFFTPLRKLVIHQADGDSLKALYGHKEGVDTVAWNVPRLPIQLKIIPQTGNELVDVNVVGVDKSYCQRTSDSILSVYMPSKNETVYITPIFGKSNYNVTIEGNTHVDVQLSNTAPKSREEVEVTLISDKGYIPSNISITGCQSWWLVDKPQRESDGRWKTVYRFKVDLQDVTIDVGAERVYSLTVNDTQHSGRVKTYIPEMIPDYPGVARKDQQIPVVFTMPKQFSATYTAKADKDTPTPIVYHNALKNSFADQGMAGWTETNDYVGAGLSMVTETAADGNNYWRASVNNTMSQTVSLAGRTFPAHAKTDNKLKIGALASMNPYRAPRCEASVVAIGDGMADTLVVADMSNGREGWQSKFITGEVAASARELKFVVTAKGDNPDRKYTSEGPMFDDLCLLLPTDGDVIKDEDVLVFKMGETDVTIDYTPQGTQSTVTLQTEAHATVMLINTATDEQGTTVKAMEGDTIWAKGKADEGHAIYGMKYFRNGQRYRLILDTLDAVAREVSYYFVKMDDKDVTITMDVDVVKVDTDDCYGGTLTVSNENAREGEEVTVTVKTDAGCRLKRITTSPGGIAIDKTDNVDATTGAGDYTFKMPGTQITLTPEFIVPITTAAQLDDIHQECGEFNLENDIDLGDGWNSGTILSGHFNGNGHRITYSGRTSLFESVDSCASVRHLYVTANIEGEDSYIGGIAMYNNGVIEDCEVSGTIKNSKENYGVAAGVAGQNGPREGTVSHCHVVCDDISGATAYGIAWQTWGATVSDNVFSGRLTANNGLSYVICNDVNNSTIANNRYMSDAGATVCNGATAATPAELADLAKDQQDAYPVFAASIRSRYSFYNVTTSKPDYVTTELTPMSGGAGTVVKGTVTVSGNYHLESIVLSAPDGSDAQNCAFDDNTENVYEFSFTMPAHDVLVTFKTQVGTLIYTAKQLSAISDKSGTYILRRDIDLHNWTRKVTLNGHFRGDGHTIRYDATESCKGLFQKIRKGAVLEGLRVVGYVESEIDCAGIAYDNQGTIRDCHFCGRISRITSPDASMNRIAAIAYKVNAKAGRIDHCSATGELICRANQDATDRSPLCAQSDAKVNDSVWVSATDTARYQEQTNVAHAALNDWPVFAQGILDRTTPRIIVGSDTLRVGVGETLSELTITDGVPFVCTGDVKVGRIVYKRRAMSSLEQWVLPFDFNRIAGNGTLDYHEFVKNSQNKLDIGDANKLMLTEAPTAVSYRANDPWMVMSDGSDVKSYVLTNADGPITVKATNSNYMAHDVSASDIGTFYVTYDGIPAATAKEEIMHDTWDNAKKLFVPADGTSDIKPFRFYLQFYDKVEKKYVTYAETGWATGGASTSQSPGAAPRRLASAMADGWQPIFLDPRQPQSVTARMLDYYEVACLADARSESVGEEGDEPLSVVTLVYRMVDSRTELPAALPLLVRAKRSDAEPLVDEKTGAEIEALILQSWMDDDDDDDDADDFEMPHYWCAAFGERLDVWPLPSPAKYADLAEYGCMMFNDSYYNQSFLYATGTDNRTTTPMSYCITVLNTNTYELLPLMGDRVNVEFIGTGETTSVETVQSSKFNDQSSYNLNGQRVGASYKGIILQNGRKVIRR